MGQGYPEAPQAGSDERLSATASTAPRHRTAGTGQPGSGGQRCDSGRRCPPTGDKGCLCKTPAADPRRQEGVGSRVDKVEGALQVLKERERKKIISLYSILGEQSQTD